MASNVNEIMNHIDTIIDADTGETYSVRSASEDSFAKIIKLSVDENFRLTVGLKNSETDDTLSEATIDLPIENAVVNATHANGVITLTLQNGENITVDGLTPTSRQVNGKTLSSDVTLTQDDIGDGTDNKVFTAQNKTDLATLMTWYESKTYTEPTLSGVSSTPNGGTYEKGVTKTVTKIAATVKKGTSNVTKLEAFDGSTVLGTITEDSITGAKSFTGLNVEVKTNKKFTVKATCADGKTKTAYTTAFTFVYPYYAGLIDVNATIDAATITSLSKLIESQGTKKVNFTSANQKMVFASPYAVKKITDPNNFDVTSTFTENRVSITGLDGTAQSYYVYVANDAATVSAFVMTFTH